jgi:hypothetical protein
MKPLGRKVPTDWRHLGAYPLLAALPTTPTPVVIGVNWYRAFDSPQRSGNIWRIPNTHNLGSIRGGHAICLEPKGGNDVWWPWYNQNLGSCTGQSAARCMSIFNRRRYDPCFIWREARLHDEWSDNDDLSQDGGSSVRAAFWVLANEGAVRARETQLRREDGIAVYRWALSAEQVLQALGTPERDYVVLLNSWGRAWPHRVRLPAEVLDRLLAEDGEAGLPTDR